MQDALTKQYSELIPSLADLARNLVRDLDPQNDLEFLRIRSFKHEIMVAASESEEKALLLQHSSTQHNMHSFPHFCRGGLRSHSYSRPCSSCCASMTMRRDLELVESIQRQSAHKVRMSVAQRGIHPQVYWVTALSFPLKNTKLIIPPLTSCALHTTRCGFDLWF